MGAFSEKWKSETMGRKFS